MNFPFFVMFSPWKNGGPSLKKPKQTWIPFTLGWIELSLVEIGPVVLEKNYENMKSLRQQRRRQRQRQRQRTTDKFWSPAMMTCPNEWKILSGMKNSKQANKQTKLNPLDSDSACLVWFKWVLEKIFKCWRCIFTVAIISLCKRKCSFIWITT